MALGLGIFLVLTILYLVWYAVKGRNLMVGFFLVAVLWTIVGIVGNVLIKDGDFANSAFGGKQGLEAILFAIKTTFQDGPEGYGKDILVNIFFGALLGRILIDTNIAATIVKKTVELSGDKPRVTLSFICLITTLLFVNMTGIGPVVAVAVIVFPILRTIGIPSTVSTFAFMGSVMAGILINPINFAQYYSIILQAAQGASSILGQDFVNSVQSFSYGDYSTFGWIAAAVTLVAVQLTCNIALGFKKKTYAWAVDYSNKKETAVKKDAPAYSWIALLIPVVLVTVFNIVKQEDGSSYTSFSTILAFIIASVYALITTGHFKGGYRNICIKFSKYFTDGAIEVAPMIGFLLALAMFNKAAGLNIPYLKAIVGNLIPSTALALATVFAFMSILSFFRGPTNLVGAGAALPTIVFLSLNPESAAALGILFIYCLFSITTIIPQHLDITQSWVAWGLGYSNVPTKKYLKMTIPTAYISAIALCFLAFAMYGL